MGIQSEVTPLACRVDSQREGRSSRTQLQHHISHLFNTKSKFSCQHHSCSSLGLAKLSDGSHANACLSCEPFSTVLNDNPVVCTAGQSYSSDSCLWCPNLTGCPSATLKVAGQLVCETSASCISTGMCRAGGDPWSLATASVGICS